jgi:hypothetical protein
VQPHAERFGEACSVDPAYIVNFGEETVRSLPVFALSPLLRWLEPMLRETAGIGSWQARTVPGNTNAIHASAFPKVDLACAEQRPGGDLIRNWHKLWHHANVS